MILQDTEPVMSDVNHPGLPLKEPLSAAGSPAADIQRSTNRTHCFHAVGLMVFE